MAIARDQFLQKRNIVTLLPPDYATICALERLHRRFPEAHTICSSGDHLPEFLRTLDDLPKKEFCCDLARLELLLTGVFDAEETPPLTEAAVRAVPQKAWETARLKPIQAFGLGSFEYPVSQYLGGVDEENPFPRIARKKTWIVAYRRDFNLHRSELERPAYELLSALASGQTVGEAIVGIMTRKWRPAVKESRLFEWFRDWMAEGLFQAVELQSKPERQPKSSG